MLTDAQRQAARREARAAYYAAHPDMALLAWMRGTWGDYNARYFDGQLTAPLSFEFCERGNGRCILLETGEIVIQLHRRLFAGPDKAAAASVMLHEMAHQALFEAGEIDHTHDSPAFRREIARLTRSLGFPYFDVSRLTVADLLAWPDCLQAVRLAT